MGKLIWIITIFIVIGGYMIYNSLNTDFSNTDSSLNFAGKFTGWLFQVGKSSVKTAGYAMGQDWLPNINQTNSTNSTGK